MNQYLITSPPSQYADGMSNIRNSRADTRRVASQAISTARKDASISQSGLSQRMGVSQPLISSWENGRTCPSIEDVVAIEKALQLNPCDLVTKIAMGLYQDAH
jgi:ribosome-binding protein aMBF1 (putative translation factor)